MKHVSILLMIVILLIPVAMVNAQEPLEVGAPLDGEITNSEFEVEYSFTGTAGSVVIINMPTLDDDGFNNDLSGQLILLDSSNAVVADTADDYNYWNTALVTQLPADDDYVVIATREDGRSGDTEGTYVIELIAPDVMGMGDTVTGASTNNASASYFVVNSEEEFVLLYEKTAGDFNPEISINVINDTNSDLDPYATACGKLDGVAMGTMDAGVYIVKAVDESCSDSPYFDEVTADFEISIVAAG